MRRWLIPAVVLLIVVCGLGWFWWTQPPAIVRRLPAGQTVVYINLEPLRSAGLLATQPAIVRTPSYAAFVRESGFDYERDLDAMALTLDGAPWSPRDATALLQGHFGPSFAAYLRAHALARRDLEGAEAYTFPGWARPQQLLTIVPLGGGRVLITNSTDAAPIVRRARRWWNAAPAAAALWQPGGGWRGLIAYAGVNTEELAAERVFDGTQPPLAGLERLGVRLRAGGGGIELSGAAPAHTSADAAADTRWLATAVEDLRRQLRADPQSAALAASLARLQIGQSGPAAWFRWPLDAALLQSWWRKVAEKPRA